MQTFLPYPDFTESAKVLDTKRLGKQRLECLQILSTLLGDSDGWEDHPAVRMWEGHEGALLLYSYAIVDEWVGRGYNDTCKEQLAELEPSIRDSTWFDPDWMGDEEFHRSHQSNLLRKDSEHYGRHFIDVPEDLEYVWPVREIR